MTTEHFDADHNPINDNPINDERAYKWAIANQGYTGTFAEWQAMGADERAEYEQGAAGIPTA